MPLLERALSVAVIYSYSNYIVYIISVKTNVIMNIASLNRRRKPCEKDFN